MLIVDSIVTLFLSDSAQSQAAQFDYTKTLSYVLSAGIAAFATFGLTAWYYKAQIRKINSDVVINHLKLKNDMREATRSVEEIHEKIVHLVTDLSEAWTNNMGKELISIREELCLLLCQNLIPSLKHASELGCMRWADHPDRQFKYVTVDLAKILKEISSWIHMLNHKSILDRIGQGPLTLKRESLEDFRDLALELPKNLREQADKTIKSIIDDICE
jgi:hypothetical protein